MGCSGDAAPTKKCHISIFQYFNLFNLFPCKFLPPPLFF